MTNLTKAQREVLTLMSEGVPVEKYVLALPPALKSEANALLNLELIAETMDGGLFITQAGRDALK